jgi:squalene cyclase
MKLLGLYWAGADAGALKKLAADILARQRPDGGWRQHDGLVSDAYATGQTLYVLAKTSTLAPSDRAYQNGVQFLLKTQNANGAWRVVSRAPKFQAFFASGFPFAGNQWISAWATGWATMALAQAVPAREDATQRLP